MTHGALSRSIISGTDPDIVSSYETLAERALTEVFGFEDELAFVDLETTGLDHRRDRIIEVAVVVADGPRVVERYSTLVDPGIPIPRETTHLTGITDEMVAGMPSAEEAVVRLAQVVDGRDIVAHNVGFDCGFLERSAHVAGVTFQGAWLDSLHVARIALPRMRSHRLQDLAAAFGLEAADHRALADAEAVFGLWRVALCALWDLPDQVVTSIATMVPGTEWAARSVFAHVAAGRPSAGADLRPLRESRVRTGRRVELPDAFEVELASPERSDVSAEFEPGGAVTRMYESFETRGEQIEMTEAVLGAFAEGRHLAVEAGTGVGKSVAYLVPAIRFACANGVSVGISTKTNALMDQLVHTELPALKKELPDEFEYVALKGYSHYLCLRKVDRYLSGTSGATSPATAATLVAWIAQSTWGDLHALNLHWTRELRAAVTASSEECTKKRCRFYPDLCYLHGARRRAACAHVVVTNHALLFSNVMAHGGILPPIRHWIIDEAHSAEDVARDQLSVHASHSGLNTLLKGLAAKKGTPLQALLMRADEIADTSHALEAEEAARKVQGEAQTALTITASMFEYVRELFGEGVDGYDRSEKRLAEELRGSGPWGRVAGTGASLGRHLTTLLDHGARLLALMEEGGVKAPDDRADLSGQLGGVAEQLHGLSVVLDGSQDSFVYSVAADRRPDVMAGRLDARVIDVGAVLAERFFAEVRSAVLTSATITTGDDLTHFARSVGLDRAEGGYAALRLPSSYDLERQMVAFVTSDAPDPRAADYLARMGDLLFGLHVAMGGSVLTLFTNRRDLETLYHDVGERLEAEGLKLVGQVRGESPRRLRDEFVGDEHASLFATKSFWEGFDAKGDTLRCVVVVRLPFAHPGDPLLEELRERDSKSWWGSHYLPQAILELKQAAGRLIRSSTDEGCLVIADPRVVSGRSYGKRFLDALPVSAVRVATTAEVVAEVTERFGRGD